MTARIEWRHAYRNADTLELLKVAYETMAEPITPQLSVNRADRRRAVSAIRRIR
jgi:hypothetical protein